MCHIEINSRERLSGGLGNNYIYVDFKGVPLDREAQLRFIWRGVSSWNISAQETFER